MPIAANCGWHPPQHRQQLETERYAGRPETIAAMRKALEKAGAQPTQRQATKGEVTRMSWHPNWHRTAKHQR